MAVLADQSGADTSCLNSRGRSLPPEFAHRGFSAPLTAATLTTRFQGRRAGHRERPRELGSPRWRLSSKRPARGLLLGACLGLVLVGCDLGTYDQRATERLDVLQQKAEMARLLRKDQYTPLTDTQGQPTGISLLHPTWFADPSGQLSVRMLEQEPKRVIPPGIMVPGLTYTHEWFVQSEDGTNLAFYVYHGVLPRTEEMTAEQVQAQVEANIEQALPDATLRWETEQFPRLKEEGTIDWKCLKLIVGQEFAGYSEGETELRYIQKEGFLWFCLHSTPTHHVLLAWRVPAEVNEKLELLPAAEASMGSLRIEETTGGNAPAS